MFLARLMDYSNYLGFNLIKMFFYCHAILNNLLLLLNQLVKNAATQFCFLAVQWNIWNIFSVLTSAIKFTQYIKSHNCQLSVS